MSETTEMIHASPREGGLADMRALILAAPSEQIQQHLAEFDARRKTWRDWLREKLIEGVHFGFPPGCIPKYVKEDGTPCLQSEAYGVAAGNSITPLWQWQPKPSLYKAGADFVVELMNCRESYASDIEAWTMLGSPKGTFVIKCQLFSRATGELLGEGIGARATGIKKMDDNASVKMAQKNAKVAAVINTYGLADLFTQDLEDAGPEIHDNPTQHPDAPKAAPRSERAALQDVKAFYHEWKKFRNAHKLPSTDRAFEDWVGPLTGMNPTEVATPGQWTLAELQKCRDALKEEIAAYA